MKVKKLIAILGVVANFFLAIGKLVVGTISKSSSIFADGVNSLTDIVSSTISYIGIKFSEKPADKEHPYGHEKAEVLAGLLITLIIFFSGIWIIYSAILSIIYNQETQLSLLSFIVMGSSAFINWLMSSLKLHFGKKYNSLSLISDGIHSRIDLLVSLSIFVGLFFIKYFSFLDEVLALLVGIYILRESISLGKETTDILIGTQADKKIENEIKKIIKNKKIKLLELKTQKMGEHIFAQIKVELHSGIKLEKATKIVKNLEEKLKEKIPQLKHISIETDSKHLGKKLLKKGVEGLGPGGNCICKNCGNKIKHQKGIACFEIKCSKCGGEMQRENGSTVQKKKN